MNYYTHEFSESFELSSSAANKFNAGSKARNDIEKILDQIGAKRIPILIKMRDPAVPDSYISKVSRIFSNTKSWLKSLDILSKGDTVFIQYPWTDSFILYSKVLNKISKKKAKSVAVVHDLNILRNLNNSGIKLKIKQKYQEELTLKLFDYIIVHNEKMKQVLINRGFDSKKLIVLEIFDYLTDESFTGSKVCKELPIVIAGNLSPEKSSYIYQLHNIKDVNFNLYGANYTCADKYYSNISYKGKFRPEQLPNVMEGSFGLVWDGDTVKTCGGDFGNYLRFNNPHKTSLYIASGLPVIVWNESAMASFVKKNNIGIAVSSLYELHDKITGISNEQYDKMCENVRFLSLKLRDGFYFKKAIDSTRQLFL